MDRIAHVLSFVGYGGGVQVSFRSYYESVQEDNQYHHMVYGTHPLSPHYASIDQFENLRRSFPAKIRFLRDLISSGTVVHFYNYLCNTSVATLLGLLPARHVVMHERGASWNYPESAGRWARLNAERSEIVLANSEAAKTLITERWGVPREKTEVVYNGVISTGACSGEKGFKPPDNGTFLIGYIGRLDSPKGVFTLIDAAAELRGRPDIRFEIVGEGVLREELQRYASELAVGDKVRFRGGVRDPYPVISRFDVLVAPSIREPLGNVVIEAGVLSKPVVASAVDGLPEVVGDAGVLLEPTKSLRSIRTPGAVPYPEVVVDASGKLSSPRELDPVELAESLTALIDDPDRRFTLGRRLYKRVHRLFTLESYARRIGALYERLLDR